MPTLEPHADGDRYYAKVYRGDDRVGTWQISPGGVDWLEKQGCGVGQRFSLEQLDELISLRLATNDGGLIQGNRRTAARTSRSPSFNEVQPNGLLKGPRLLLQVMRASGGGHRHADRSKWYLELALPGYQEPDGKAGRDLRKCHLTIAHSSGFALPVESLKAGPQRVQVLPRTERYTVTIEGAMPAKWRCSLWTAGADGLNGPGTLITYFDGGSRRLQSGEPATIGKGYYLLTRPGRGELPVPACVVQRTFLSHRGWLLHYIQLPEEADAGITNWLHLLGNPIHKVHI